MSSVASVVLRAEISELVLPGELLSRSPSGKEKWNQTSEAVLVPRMLLLSKRGTVFITNRDNAVLKSFDAADVVRMLPCIRLSEEAEGESSSGERVVEMIPFSAGIFVQDDLEDEPSLQCVFQSLDVLTEFSKYLKYYNELRSQRLAEEQRKAEKEGKAAAKAAEAPHLHIEEAVFTLPKSGSVTTESEEEKVEYAINPFNITHSHEVADPSERLRIRAEPQSVWDSFAIPGATTINREYLDEFHSQADSIRIHQELQDKERAQQALLKARHAAQWLRGVQPVQCPPSAPVNVVSQQTPSFRQAPAVEKQAPPALHSSSPTYSSNVPTGGPARTAPLPTAPSILRGQPAGTEHGSRVRRPSSKKKRPLSALELWMDIAEQQSRPRGQ